MCALALVGSCGLAGAASSTASAAGISAHLTKTSFTRSQGGATKGVRAISVSAGSGHTCAVLSNHTVKCWGANGSGQLGNGTTTSSPKPVTVSRITNATQVSAGGEHTCALLSNHTVKCWGDNSEGQLGDGSADDGSGTYEEGERWPDKKSRTPVTVTGITDATQVSAGDSHTCALLSDHTVKCWGFNLDGQLGDGVENHGYEDFYGSDISPTPVTVSGITNAAQVSAGVDFTCALLSDGTIKCWGDNENGELGSGTATREGSTTPITVSGITNATQVSAGEWYACARLSNRTVKCWGINWRGNLGNGTLKDSSTPVAVSGITTATEASAGYGNTCALLSNHTVRCWGGAGLGDGVLDHGSTQENGNDISLKPVKVSWITNATRVSAGGGHSCALLSGGKVKCWGDNDSGQLGNGTIPISRKPVRVGRIMNATQVSAGEWHSCALLSDHTVECWGDNGRGQLGNGTTTSSQKPVRVSGITNATQVSAGGTRTCALLSDHTVKCWGYNRYGYGNLGAGWTTYDPKPAKVSGITSAIQVSVGGSHTCVLVSGGTVKCWGSNWYGQLGNGKTANSRKPVKVSGITNAIEVSAGKSHTCALLSDHTARCWGDNEYGQLGNRAARFFSNPKPVKVSGLTNATQVSAGGSHTCARLSNGRSECWGDNGHGQLGNGKTPSSWTPVMVKGIANAARVTAAGTHTCALLSNRTVKCWGDNRAGQLGNGRAIGSRTPVKVSGIRNATQVNAGARRNCALLYGGTVKRWGANDEEPFRTTPVSVIGIP